ncbi:hypothetical protein BH683_025455 [Williamsia sp. 1138]|nr:hypothetical protein BH683_025455 [Williamsia sp. 1138]
MGYGFDESRFIRGQVCPLRCKQLRHTREEDMFANSKLHPDILGETSSVVIPASSELQHPACLWRICFCEFLCTH